MDKRRFHIIPFPVTYQVHLALSDFRTTLLDATKEYRTVEKFCWHNRLTKATISNLLNGKKDFQISTLLKIAKKLNKRLVIRLEDY